MSLHKLTAGSGYDYLTRQVAALDATEKGHTTLGSYYSEKGEAPGRWVGSGVAGIEGLNAGDIVDAEQMKALFAYGFHPLAGSRVFELGTSASEVEVRQAQRLGTPYKVFAGDVSAYLVEVARRIETLNVDAGRSRSAAVPADQRARIRTEVAREFFIHEHGRPPCDARELAATIARLSRPRTTAVAGFDLTFSPVKSVSALWAVSEPWVAAKIEGAHDAAVGDALRFIESEALFTRRGTNGVRQVDVNGIVATAFTHRDSRAGDPDLHTHVAVANKVQAVEDGAWLAIDGRLLYASAVTASEVYNTALEKHLTADLGIRFAERKSDADRRKRPVREIVGVDDALSARWSSRRASIASRKDELTVQFQSAHSRPPTPVEAIQLAQQATLETRDAKHEPRSLQGQRQAWRREALEVLGDGRALREMVDSALARDERPGKLVDQDWISRTASSVVSTLEEHRSTWRVHHVRSEVQRGLRSADLRPDQLDDVSTLLTDAVVDRSVVISSDHDRMDDPAQLRRRDGSSVYTVAGATVFTSKRILDAEQRIVANAKLDDGRRIPDDLVTSSLEESKFLGLDLNADQVSLVRGMATSGRRVQLGIAAAGTGKTTAMRALTQAWTDAGGTVVGMAPSAAAATQLRDQTGATTDTLAKLIHAHQTEDQSRLIDQINPQTLVIIDEAGMADTLSLDTAIGLALSRGASVRLIGDDQQLAAIGAGGVLRDIKATHGALHLSELLRFADPAEGAAGLALRDGLPESLGFYLDNDRVHVGDVATLTQQVFEAWQSDRNAGLDSIMLAPTRELAAELNFRARDARLAGSPDTDAVASLADGNQASAGDIVLTRRNERRLRTSPTDWVKNGDRWLVETVNPDHSLLVKHTQSGLHATLPAQYVREDTELGYATTVHCAQGVSVDTMHGIATGEETRQQLYTMMTRGRSQNHAYLVTASDGDPHSLTRPESVHPHTPTDILLTMLARDGAPSSATTIGREEASPEVRLGPATARYEDALHVAARDVIGARTALRIKERAESAVPGIADEPAWPALFSHLVLRQAQGHDAAANLDQVLLDGELDGVEDRAAILDWRLDPTGLRGLSRGPLPWLPEVPAPLASSEVWGGYLQTRAHLVERLADRVRENARLELPAWADQGGGRPSDDLLADVAVWRAANAVPVHDRRPTGPRRLQKAAAAHQLGLEERISHGRSEALRLWGPIIDEVQTSRDAFTPLLAERLAAMGRAGIRADAILRQAASESLLPDEHISAALWWRITRQLSPVVAATGTQEPSGEPDWAPELIGALGTSAATTVMSSRQWPALIAAVEQAGTHGWSTSAVMDIAGQVVVDDVDLAQALIWQIALITDPLRDAVDVLAEPEWDPPPADMDLATSAPPSPAQLLEEAATDRGLLGPLEPTDIEINRMIERAYVADTSPVSPERIIEINELATQFYESQLNGSWAHDEFQRRLRHDVSGDDRFRAGFAPAGWTCLVTHLRAQGVADDEMLTADVAQRASTGRLIDRFRDRAMLPIIHERKVLGFVGRRNPHANDPIAGPKYLNTRETVAFHKGAQLYGIADPDMTNGSVPVLVEGPFDALAVTLASGGAFLGVAPLGTSLTEEQAAQLGRLGRPVTVATDGDHPGRAASARAYWLLSLHALEARTCHLPDEHDPADILRQDGPAALTAAVQSACQLGSFYAAESPSTAVVGDVKSRIAAAIAASPVDTWPDQLESATRRLHVPPDDLATLVAAHSSAFAQDRRRFIADRIDEDSAVRRPGPDGPLAQSTTSHEASAAQVPPGQAPSRPRPPAR